MDGLPRKNRSSHAGLTPIKRQQNKASCPKISGSFFMRLTLCTDCKEIVKVCEFKKECVRMWYYYNRYKYIRY